VYHRLGIHHLSNNDLLSTLRYSSSSEPNHSSSKSEIGALVPLITQRR
jgi:hypothetical protein